MVRAGLKPALTQIKHMELIFATNNQHKLHEVKEKLRLNNSNIQIVSLSDIGFFDEIPETSTTLYENALQKAQAVHDYVVRRGVACSAPI